MRRDPRRRLGYILGPSGSCLLYLVGSGMNSAQILPFDREFDGTNMNPEEIMREARKRNWPGISIDTNNFMATGKLTVRRMTRRDAYRD